MQSRCASRGWECATCLWRAGRDRDVLITTGLQSNRWLRIADDTMPQGWRWQPLRAYLAGLTAQDVVHASWPRGGQAVSVPVVTTRVRKRYGCPVVMVRHSLSAPLSQARSWASSDREADTETRLAPLSARWDSEILLADGKEARGLDQEQLMSAQALVRSRSPGDAALRLSGARAAPLAAPVATPGDHRRRSTRDPASSSSPMA